MKSSIFRIIFFLLGSQLLSVDLIAQDKIKTPELIATHPGKASFRGISVVHDKVIWVSGSKGTVGMSTNGGKNWKWIHVKGYESRDFRDIEAMDSTTAVIMAVGEPAIILRTTDGGISWEKVFFDERPGMFLDAMHFKDANQGIVVGDPIEQRPFLATTSDGGKSWQVYTLKSATGNDLLLDAGEAFFAASGSNIELAKGSLLAPGWMVTGGNKSSMIHTEGQALFELPFQPGGTSRGANAIAMKNSMQGIIVGGDFSNDTSRSNNCLLVNFQVAGLKVEPLFIRPATPPRGYRSCVQYLFRKTWVTCGTSGVDITTDDGMHWEWLSGDSFHTLGYARKGKYVYLAGGGGRIARLAVR